MTPPTIMAPPTTTEKNSMVERGAGWRWEPAFPAPVLVAEPALEVMLENTVETAMPLDETVETAVTTISLVPEPALLVPPSSELIAEEMDPVTAEPALETEVVTSG